MDLFPRSEKMSFSFNGFHTHVLCEFKLKTALGMEAQDPTKRLEELQMELLKLASSNADYEKVGDEIYRLRDQKQELQVENANRDELKKRMADMSTFLKKQSTALSKYDEQLVRRLIEKVTVYEDKFTVEFKSGVTVDVIE